jgi:hypothetical protein
MKDYILKTTAQPMGIIITYLSLELGYDSLLKVKALNLIYFSLRNNILFELVRLANICVSKIPALSMSYQLIQCVLFVVRRKETLSTYLVNIMLHVLNAVKTLPSAPFVELK